MIIDETAGSGGDMLPWMFRKFKVGTLVGKRTWGGLVGILGFPEFIDGGSVTAPNVAIWTKDGFVVENVGVEKIPNLIKQSKWHFRNWQKILLKRRYVLHIRRR
jgi:C-terminal processing protease CtpA/Prc